MMLDVMMATAKPMAVICRSDRSEQIALILVCLLISLIIAFGKPMMRKLKEINKKYHVVTLDEEDDPFTYDDDED